jgi:hypothetical protein
LLEFVGGAKLDFLSLKIFGFQSILIVCGVSFERGGKTMRKKVTLVALGNAAFLICTGCV